MNCQNDNCVEKFKMDFFIVYLDLIVFCFEIRIFVFKLRMYEIIYYLFSNRENLKFDFILRLKNFVLVL